jgi:hypothetical protein
MDALACIDVVDLDDTASPFADRVDRMNAKAAITDKPRHHQLSHRKPLLRVQRSLKLGSIAKGSAEVQLSLAHAELKLGLRQVN